MFSYLCNRLINNGVLNKTIFKFSMGYVLEYLQPALWVGVSDLLTSGVLRF